MPKVKAAVLERSRRSTAGKRMQSLMGKAQEDDDAFWSHSIWSEGGGGFSSGRKRQRGDGDDSSSSSGSGSDSDSLSDGEGSFRMSDEESDAAVDQFDSDFDESESEDEEEGGEGATERELIAEERRNKVAQRKKRQQVAFQGKGSSGGRELMKKKKGQMTKRGPTGEGLNAGLVLNWPTAVPSEQLSQTATKLAAATQISAQISTPVAASSSVVPALQSQSTTMSPEVAQTTSSALKTTQSTSPKVATSAIPKSAAKSTAAPRHNLRGSNSSKQKEKDTVIPKITQPAVTSKKNTAQKPRITQEELIIEAIKSTEMENSKWLSGRKRAMAEVAHRENAATAKTINHNPVSRFHSRRGCHNTLTFMDMDHLPDILTRSHPRKTSAADTSTIRSPRKRRADSTASQGSSSSPDIEKEQTKCVITGKVARYRDPKTMMGYYDIDAFKELRRRLEAGELPKKEKKKAKISTKQSTKLNASPTGDGSTTFAKLSPTGADVKVKIKVGDIVVSPPPAEKKKDKTANNSTPNKPRWDDASDNLYAKPFSSSKRRRSSSLPQNGESSQPDAAQSKPSSGDAGKIDASQSKEAVLQNNGNLVGAKSDSTLSPPPTPSSTAAAADSGKPENGSTAKPDSGTPSAVPPKKSNAELKPTPAELNKFMQTWISRPENKNNLMPSLLQKQQIIDEIGVDKKRLEGWFYRIRKKMKQETPPDKQTQQTTVNGEDCGVVKTDNQVGRMTEKEVVLSQKDPNNNSESKSTPTSEEQGNRAIPNGKSTSADKDDKNDSQIPLVTSNGSNADIQTK